MICEGCSEGKDAVVLFNDDLYLCEKCNGSAFYAEGTRVWLDDKAHDPAKVFAFGEAPPPCGREGCSGECIKCDDIDEAWGAIGYPDPDEGLTREERKSLYAPTEDQREAVKELTREAQTRGEYGSLVTPEPAPVGGCAVEVWHLVMDDMQGRDRFGHRKYGTPLKAHNGRDALKDAYQEALDLCVYLRQAIFERDGR